MRTVNAPDRDEVTVDDRSLWQKRPISVVLVALFLIAALASLVVTIFFPRSPQTTGPAAPHRAPVAAGPADSACGLPNGDQAVPESTPPDSPWVPIGTVLAPTSPQLGPAARSREGLPYCYARSPIGALYAAANFGAAVSDPSLRLAAARFLTAPGGGHDELVAAMAKVDVGSAGSGLQVAGFRIISYTPDAAAINMLLYVDAGTAGRGRVNWPVGLAWTGGDWKVKVDPDGQVFGPHLTPVTVATGPNQPGDRVGGYIHWAGGA